VSEPRQALVAGATGLVGGHVVERLLADAAYGAVTALGRRPLELSHPDLTSAVVDFDRLDQAAGALAADDVFCCLGTTRKQAGSEAAFRKVDQEYVVALARLARQAGAERFLLVSSVGANARSGNFYLRVKGETEDAVAALGYPTFHVFRPSFLLGDRPEARTGERLGILAARALDPLVALLKPLARYRPVHARTVAAAMIAAALAGDRGRQVHTFSEIRRLASAA
jgi:uncharacterized protein YbjT (DUF2867 family)